MMQVDGDEPPPLNNSLATMAKTSYGIISIDWQTQLCSDLCSTTGRDPEAPGIEATVFSLLQASTILSFRLAIAFIDGLERLREGGAI